MAKKQKQTECKNPRLGCVGGQAVMEGVMMRSKTQYTTAVRLPDGTIVRDTHPNTSVKDKHKWLGIPVLRGCVNFIEMLKLSFSTLTFSAEAIGEDIQEETKFEKWLKKVFGESLMMVAAVIGMVLGVVLAVSLFIFLPTLISGWITAWIDFGSGEQIFRSVFEGVLKIGIFVLYTVLISFMSDIRRTFEYHGAEHKSIFCYESGEELTVENVRKQKRLHPRCGTSFMIVMMLLGIILGMAIPAMNVFLRTAIRLLILPLIVGIGYEILMYAGKHDNAVIRTLTKPGIWMQYITTKEPDDRQIEVAIAALRSALPDQFSEDRVFVGFEEARPKEENKAEEETDIPSADVTEGKNDVEDTESNAF